MISIFHGKNNYIREWIRLSKITSLKEECSETTGTIQMDFPIARDSLAFGICGSEEQSPLNFTRFQVCEISNKLGNNLHSFDVLFMLHHKLQSIKK